MSHSWQADGAHLAAELPDARSKTKKEKIILFPTSVRAGSELQVRLCHSQLLQLG